jgi:light-regulated signal transduction histidine kinase (bacteriophytochrome)
MHILIIDDTEADHAMCVDYLQDEGEVFHFLHAYTGAQGLALYQTHVVDCVLLDYHLPDMDGLAVLRQLGAKDVPVPVIMMTAEGSEMVAVTAMKFGSHDYLPKKVITASALRRAIERATDRADMIRKMEQYRAELERSNHDLEQFSNIVAHDLKAPLRAVTQHLSLIRNRNAAVLDEKSLRSLAFAVDGAERMRLLIEALFTYARLGFSPLVWQQVSLESALHLATHDLAASIEERDAVITHDALPEVTGDPILLCQLLQNLLANAIKYCTQRPRIHVSATYENEAWHIHVADNGIGIAAAQHEKIFAIFRRLHSEDAYPGIGLGLAVCQRIVQQHGGAIRVASEAGKGAVFSFILPAASVAVAQRQVAYVC